MTRWGGALLVLLLIDAAPVEAHPHVFVEYTVQVTFSANGPEGVRFAWSFDEFFSSMILESYDLDRNRTFSPSETQAVERKHFGKLEEYQYFVDIQLGERPIKVTTIRDFQVRVAGGIVTYLFTVPITIPPSPAGELKVVLEDPTIFTALEPAARSPITVQAPKHYHVDCRVATEGEWRRPLILCKYRRQGR